MGGYVKNNVFWGIRSNEDFSQENFINWEEKIEDLDHIQIYDSLHEISQSNLQKLHDKIFQKKEVAAS